MKSQRKAKGTTVCGVGKDMQSNIQNQNSTREQYSLAKKKNYVCFEGMVSGMESSFLYEAYSLVCFGFETKELQYLCHYNSIKWWNHNSFPKPKEWGFPSLLNFFNT